MKRVALILLALLIGLPLPACAQSGLHWLSPTIGGNDAVMIVDNGQDWRTKLNLRAEQRKDSEIRGRIYTGTRVELYQDNGEWCTVGLNFGGDNVLTGDVMKQYLTPLRDGFSALCPLAVAKTEIEVLTSTDTMVANLRPGDTAYVLAVCGEEYFLMIPDVGQGYAPASAFEPLTEPREEKRIVYQPFYVPEGGLSFVDEQTGDTVSLAGGVLLEDCWKIGGDTEWHVTFGAGIQRSPRVQGVIPRDKLASKGGIPFEGEVYAYGMSFITCVGTINGQPILRRVDQNGDVFWAAGAVPKEAALIDNDLYEIKCEAKELLSCAAMERIFAYVSERGVLDERTSSESVSPEVVARCTLYAALVLDPALREVVMIRAWLKDADGSYVTGGDLDPKTGKIVRWGCNA